MISKISRVLGLVPGTNCSTSVSEHLAQVAKIEIHSLLSEMFDGRALAEAMIPVGCAPRMNVRGGSVAVVPVLGERGVVSWRTLSFVVRSIQHMGMTARVIRSRVPWLDVTDDVENSTINGDRCLQRLFDDRVLTGFDRLLAITDMRLKGGSSGLSHGYAGMSHPVAIVSTFGMGFVPNRPFQQPDSWRRLYRVVIHELGHTLGIDHCADARCLMTKYIETSGDRPCRLCLSEMMTSAKQKGER